MGKTIESLSAKMDFVVTEIYDENNPFIESTESNADVAIDFTLPELAAKHIQHAVNIQLPIVVGTTGWYSEFESVKKHVETQKGSLFYATNFSIGVNIFFALNKALSKWMNSQDSYRVSMEEIHHTEKKDAPSGTAITLAEISLSQMDRLDSYHLVDSNSQVDTPINDASLPIHAVREPHVPGTHTLTFENDIDKIEITHEAKGRLGFAQGAVEAARFLKGKNGVFTMSDLLKF